MGIKKISAFLLAIIAVIAAISSPVSQSTALTVAGNWLANHHEIQIKGFAVSDIAPFGEINGSQLAWVVNLSPKGFIIISADNQISPIITYGTDGEFSGLNNKNTPLAKFIKKDLTYRMESCLALSENDKAKIAQQWLAFSKKPIFASTRVATTAATLPVPVATVPTVDALLTTTWNQQPSLRNDPPSYNKLTPHNYPAGCGPVAMSQLVKYHKYPDSAAVANKLITTDSDTNEINQLTFSDTFDYDLMPDVLSATSTTEEIDEVAKLMRDTGIAMSASYSSTGTSASDVNLAASLKGAFKYKSADIIDTTATPWETTVQGELNNKFPVIFTLFSTVDNYAHFVVCDGWGRDDIDNSTRYHLNMGWGGLDDNWYQMPNVSTSQFTFDNMPSIIYNIRPGDPVVIPVAPTLVSPGTGTTATIPVTISWDPLLNSVKFEYEVSANADMSNPIESDANYITTAANIAAPLTVGTRYYWRVRGFASNNTAGPWSPIWDFNAAPAPAVPTPVLNLPADSATVAIPVQFTWQSVTNAISYTLQVSAVADMSTLQVNQLATITSAIPVTTYTPGSTYYWRVRATDNRNQISSFSTIRQFTVQSAMPAPTLTLPADASTQQTPVTLSWQTVPGAARYMVTTSTNSNMSNPVNSSSTTQTNFLIPIQLIPGTTYFWQVRAYDQNNIASPLSVIRSFTVQAAAVPAPVLTAPADAATIPAPITLSWQAVAGAVRYTYAISTANDVSNPVDTGNLTTTSIQVTAQMVPDTTYYWHVSAVDQNDTVSPWSQVWSFTVEPAPQPLIAPVPTTPADNSTVSGAISLGWQTVTNASGYTYEIANDAAFNTPFETITINNNTTLTALVQTALTQGVTYYWHIRSDGAGGTFSPWSTTMRFTVQAAPVLVAPTLLTPGNNATNVTAPVSIAWSAVATASNYQYEIFSPVSATVPVETNIVDTTSAVIQATLQAGTRYTWRVRALDANDNQGPFSTSFAFTTQNQVTIGTPVLTSPADNATDISISPTLTWQSATNATVYHVEVATDAAFANIVTNNQSVATTSLALSNLTNNTVYYWRVTGGDATPRWGTPASASFTTVADAPQRPSAPVLVSPANGAVSVALNTALTWQAVATAVSYTLEYANNINFTNPTVVTGTALSASVTLNSNTRYYWRVLATDANDEVSNWSQAYFTTVNQATQLSAPNLTSPANNAVNVSVSTNFTWSTVSNALAYDVDVSTNSNFTTKASFNTVLTSQTAVLANNTLYYWRVRAKQGNTIGPWSAVSSFTTAQFVATPGLDAVIANSKGGSLIMGTNVIDTTGQGQIVQITQPINRQGEFYIAVKNTGNVPDNFLITSTSTIGTGWKVKVFDVSGIDRTRSVFSNGWASYTVKPGESVKLLMRFSATSGQIIDVANPPTQEVTIQAQSWKDLVAGSTTPATDIVTGIAVLAPRSKIQ